MVRFLHTADLQIGELLAQFPEDRGWKLRELRIAALRRLAALAREEAVDFAVCAGDFFDENTVDDRVVSETCAVLRSFPVFLYILPGNHDHGGPDSVWQRRSFQPGPNVRVLQSRDPVGVARGRAVLLPAPLLRRHTAEDPTAHFTADLGRDLAPDAIRVGLAHGAVHGFGGEEGDTVNRIDLSRVSDAGLDYLALGDWHGCKAFGERAHYPGTPEPDSFAGNDAGHALLVEIERPGARPLVRKLDTARARWDLDRLVFNPDELRVAAEAIDVVELRQTVIDQVTRLYFERRRQQVLLLRAAGDLENRLGLELRIEELTASLDGLTGGWFSARLRGAAEAGAEASIPGAGEGRER